MSPKEIRELLDRYTVRSKATKRQDNTPLYLAWYEELPFVIGQAAESRQAALAELELLMPTVMMQLLEDGVPLPEPQAEATSVTNHLQWNGIVAGEPPTIAKSESQTLTSFGHSKGNIETEDYLVEA